MKKFLASLGLLSLTLFLAACNTQEEVMEDETSTTVEETVVPEEPATEEEVVEEEATEEEVVEEEATEEATEEVAQ